jgi:hypothetical protein
MKIGYKATYDFVCRDFKFEIGQTYELSEKPIMCSRGFHYCKNARNTLKHYSYTRRFKLLEIEDLGLFTIEENDKSCTDKIRIIREINDPDELIQLIGCHRIYNENGKLFRCKDSYGYWYEYTYDKNGNVSTYKHSRGFSYEQTHNENGSLLNYKDSNGYFSESTYDHNGCRLTHKNSSGYFSESTYDENGYEITKRETYSKV